MRVARWTARKINGSYLLEYNLLNSISLPKPLPVSFRFVIGNESNSAALLLLLGLAQKLGQCLIDVVELRIGAGFQFLDAFQQLNCASVLASSSSMRFNSSSYPAII